MQFCSGWRQVSCFFAFFFVSLFWFLGVPRFLVLGLEFRITDVGCFYKFNPRYFIPNADTRKFKGKHFALQKFSDALQVLEKPFVLMSPSNNMESMYFLLDRVHTSIKQSSDLFSYYSMFFFKVVFSKDPSNAHGSADSSKLFKVRVLKQGFSVLYTILFYDHNDFFHLCSLAQGSHST